MKKLDSCKDWTAEQIEETYGEIEKIADGYGLTYYPNQIEIISSEQMLDAYASVGMPVYYSHWSFGKEFVQNSEAYKRGQMGLAYEIVINSSPCVSYLMEENSMAMQALVMAHACIGHNNFFKENHLFKQWTDAGSVIDMMDFTKHKIAEYEELYGIDEVEETLDSIHALSLQGVDRYKRPPKKSKRILEQNRKERQAFDQANFNDLWRTVPDSRDIMQLMFDYQKEESKKNKKFLEEPEENLLYFLEKNAPNLPQWKRECIRMVRKISQYFYPQRLTKVMNEGWATFWHYTIVNDMYDRGLVTDGFMLEFLQSHTGVTKQRDFEQFNPYALGFAMFQDIKRISMNPTKEDKEWFPDWAGNGDWVNTLKHAAYDYKDESFIQQFLSPKVIRDFRMFHILDDDRNKEMLVEEIHNDGGYKQIREMLAYQNNSNNFIPNIQVTDVDVWGDRHLELEHYTTRRHSLSHDDALYTLWHLSKLWGYEVKMKTKDDLGNELETYDIDARGGKL